jgi:uncharacterized protein (DUF736 family)
LSATRSGFSIVAIEATIPAASQQKEKHMIIGTFAQDGDDYTGSIHTVGLGLADVLFKAVPVKRGDAPDFAVLQEADDGDLEIGAAWSKTSKEGKPYLSVKLDWPTLASPIQCALTRQKDGSYALVWTRRKAATGGEQSAEAEAEAA